MAVMFDVYIRVRPEALKGVRLSHLQSSVDQEAGDAAAARGAGAVTGFTEWIACADRTLSVGWDWTFDPVSGSLTADWQTLRTNIMLVGEDGRDLGRQQTRQALSHLAAATPWPVAVAQDCGLRTPRVV
jgi:hypothetical protein